MRVLLLLEPTTVTTEPVDSRSTRTQTLLKILRIARKCLEIDRPISSLTILDYTLVQLSASRSPKIFMARPTISHITLAARPVADKASRLLKTSLKSLTALLQVLLPLHSTILPLGAARFSELQELTPRTPSSLVLNGRSFMLTC